MLAELHTSVTYHTDCTTYLQSFYTISIRSVRCGFFSSQARSTRREQKNIMGDKCMHALVESNPIIARKERARLKRIHQSKVKNMQSFGGSTSLPVGLHLKKGKLVRKRNLKEEQQTEEWLTSIERENRRLLEKMSLVMLGKDQDPGRYRLAAKYRHFSTVNGPARAKEQKRIDIDNSISKKRLKATDAYYKTEEWLHEREHMEVKIRYMCKYDAPLLKKGRAAKLSIKRPKRKGKGKRTRSKSSTKLNRAAEVKGAKEAALSQSLRSAGEIITGMDAIRL